MIAIFNGQFYIFLKLKKVGNSALWKPDLTEKIKRQRRNDIEPSKTKKEMKYVFFYSMLPIKNTNKVKNCFIAILLSAAFVMHYG